MVDFGQFAVGCITKCVVKKVGEKVKVVGAPEARITERRSYHPCAVSNMMVQQRC